MSKRLLVVEVVKAKNLIACERSGTSDPYVVCSLLDIAMREIKHEKFKTKTKTKTLEPEWKEKFTFGSTYDLNNQMALPTLSVSLFHKGGSLIAADLPMGCVEIPLDTLPTDGSPVTEYYKLKKFGRMKDVAGEVELKISFSAPLQKAASIMGTEELLAGGEEQEGEKEDENPDHEDMEPNELVVTVLQGQNLAIKDKSLFGKGSSDPLVKLEIHGMKKKQTKHIKKNLNPHWNETFHFPVTDESLSLEVTVEDYDLTANDFMGRVIIPLNTYYDKKPKKQWFKLKDKRGNVSTENLGDVELSIVWRFNPEIHAKNVAEAAKKKNSKFRAFSGLLGDGSDTDLDDEEGEEPEEEAVALTEEEAAAALKEKEEAEEALKKELGDTEIKSGDWQLQVHILEARELKPKDLNGLSDPIVYIEVLDEKQNSSVKPASLSCVFDELFIFNKRNLDKDDVDQAVVRVSVMDANVVTKNVLIGAYSFDMSDVYFQKDHEYYRKWVALMNDDDPEDVGVQGYLKLSVQAVGPGDKIKVHDEEAEMKKERDQMAKTGGDIGAMVIMPPTIKKEWVYVVTSIYEAEYLPVMDQSAVQLVSSNGTDAFCAIEFAGGKPLKTKTRTVKGERSAMNPIFNYELWYPVSTPTATQSIRLSVWDYDMTGSDLIGCYYSKFNLLQRLPRDPTTGHDMCTGPMWVNLYGAPVAIGFSLGSTLKAGINKIQDMAEGIDYADMYNTSPAKGSNYKGRLLISQRIATLDQRPKKYQTEEVEPFRKSIKKLNPKAKPATAVYVLKALVVSGNELPSFIDPKNPLKKQKLRIMVCAGKFDLLTEKRDVNNGVSEWNELLTSEDMLLPIDKKQLPDICVYITKGEGNSRQPICFQRFKATDLLNEKFQAPPKWIFMKEDKVLDALMDGEFPGTVLIRLGFGLKEDAEATEQDWAQSLQRMKRRSSYQVRCHLYQAKNLPAQDDNGLLDPYMKINFMGMKKKSKQIKKTRFPLYYETFSFDCELPEREFMPQVNIKVFDWDFIGKDDYCGQVFVNLQDAFILDNLDDELPDPEYYDLFYEVPGDSDGSILVSAQLIPKTTPDMVIPKPIDISPTLRTAYIEIIALGIRNMAPFQFQGMVSPFLELSIECVDKKMQIETEHSKRPTPDNPNFLQRLIMEVQLPDNALFAVPMMLRARDNRLGGFSQPEVGVGYVDMVDKIPWSKTYKAPQTDIFFVDEYDRNAGYQTASKNEEGKSNEPVLDAAAQKAVEMLESRTQEVEEDDFITTQEPIDVEKFLKDRINELDDGAGVFGALAHLELPEYGGKRRKTADDFFEEIDWDEESVDEPEKYMIDRRVLDGDLEEELKTTPFESYPLMRGQKHGTFGNSEKVAGKFKGLIRVMLNEDDPPLFDLSCLLKPQAYQIRLYVLKGTNLTPMDPGFGGRPGKSDPYLIVNLGKKKFNDRENTVDDVTDVDFYKMIEFDTELPGESQLEIVVMDNDLIGSDDVIGRTVIDLEDRWFDNRWQEIGREFRVETAENLDDLRWDVKHLERRSLYVPSSNSAQGVVECWVDILTPAEAGVFQPDHVALPPRQIFEMRMVIWKCKDVPPADTFGGQNMTDMYVKCWPEGCDAQETDTHWRAKKGKGSFNWRMVFEVELGHNTRAMKFPHLHFQLWDRDILKWNDCLAEGAIDMGIYYRKAFKKNVAIKLYETKKGAAARRVKKKNKESKVYEIEDTGADIPPPEEKLPGEEGESTSNPLNGDVDSDDEDQSAGLTAEDKQKEEGKGKDQEKESGEESSGGFFSYFRRKPKKDEEDEEKKPLMEEEEVAEPPPMTQDEEDQNAFIKTIKDATGLFDIDPDDSTWIHMDRLDHETGVREPQGKICYSIQLWPKEKADVMPVGSGRQDPNNDPYLPPPTGRLQFSWNPFVMGMQLCGPRLCMGFFCCLLCIVFALLMIFCQPVLNIIIAVVFY